MRDVATVLLVIIDANGQQHYSYCSNIQAGDTNTMKNFTSGKKRGYDMHSKESAQFTCNFN